MDPKQHLQTPQPPEALVAHPVSNQANAPSQTNNSLTIAVIGLVLAFIVPVLGLILSIIGLKKAKSSNGDGKTVAIIGIVASSLFSLPWLIWLFFIVAFGLSDLQ